MPLLSVTVLLSCDSQFCAKYFSFDHSSCASCTFCGGWLVCLYFTVFVSLRSFGTLNFKPDLVDNGISFVQCVDCSMCWKCTFASNKKKSKPVVWDVASNLQNKGTLQNNPAFISISSRMTRCRILLLQPITKLYLFTIKLKLRDDFRCFHSEMCFCRFSDIKPHLHRVKLYR